MSRTDWDVRYDTPEYVYGTTPNAFLAAVAPRMPRGRVLSLGEGEGRNGVFLAERGHTVIAVDRSRVGLRKAGRLARARGVRLAAVVADLADFPVAAEAVDAVVAIFCHVPGALRARVYAAAVAALRPGGAFVVEAYTPRQLDFGTGGPPVADLLVTLADLERELDGLTFEIAREVERDVVEGRLHRGRSAVVQLLGFRR
ncbi:MAG: methyltransferase domain-containing protein [Gemmatimonadota bacterium]|nr:methyltransferase domain-containing protein [Gemmatimonadota bacterium]